MAFIKKTCPKCNGSGRIPKEVVLKPYWTEEICDGGCGGSGVLFLDSSVLKKEEEKKG